MEDVTHDAARASPPSEPYIPFIASVDASRRGRSRCSLGSSARSRCCRSTRPPTTSSPQQLSQLSPSQARLEYRLAISQAHDLPLATRAIALGSKLVTSFDDALELVPDSFRTRDRVLAELVVNLDKRLPATSERLEEILRKAEPDSRAVLSARSGRQCRISNQVTRHRGATASTPASSRGWRLRPTSAMDPGSMVSR